MKTILFGVVVAAAVDVPTKNIVELAKSVEELSTLVTAVVAGDLVEALSSPGPFTVFAPTNEAWELLGTSADLPVNNAWGKATLSPTVDVLLKPENKGQLQELLKFHVLPYQCRTEQPGHGTEDCSTACNGGIYELCPGRDTLDSHRALTTYLPAGPGLPGWVISGQTGYDTNCDLVYANNASRQQTGHLCAQVTGPDNLATNGVVHIVNQVLVPTLTHRCHGGAYDSGTGGIYHADTDTCEDCPAGKFSNIDDTACTDHDPRASQLLPYPGYAGDLDVTGYVSASFSSVGSASVTYNLKGLEDACKTTPKGVGNACGIHIHEGKSCDDASAVGGHYYDSASISSDPWAPLGYNSRSGSARGSVNAQIGETFGERAVDIAGRAVVVHDSTGGRVACALLPSKLEVVDESLMV